MITYCSPWHVLRQIFILSMVALAHQRRRYGPPTQTRAKGEPARYAKGPPIKTGHLGRPRPRPPLALYYPWPRARTHSATAPPPIRKDHLSSHRASPAQPEYQKPSPMWAFRMERQSYMRGAVLERVRCGRPRAVHLSKSFTSKRLVHRMNA